MFEIFITLILVLVGFIAGRLAEKRHYQSIRKREAQWSRIPTTNNKNLPFEEMGEVVQSDMGFGSVAISMDYFKRIASSLKSLFGGRLGEYETLIDRGRREAVLRLKESVPWADLIYNVRLESSSIGGQGKSNGVHSIEVLAFGTAVKFASEESHVQTQTSK